MAITRVNNFLTGTCGDCGEAFKLSPHPEVEGLYLLGCLNPQCEQSLQAVRETVQADLDDLRAEAAYAAQAEARQSRLASAVVRGQELLTRFVHRPGDSDLNLENAWPGVHDSQSVRVSTGTDTRQVEPDTHPAGRLPATL